MPLQTQYLFQEYEFGWHRGNPGHYTSRFEQGMDHRFRTRVNCLYPWNFICFFLFNQVKWGDVYGGSYGEQYYEFNHEGSNYHGHPLNYQTNYV